MNDIDPMGLMRAENEAQRRELEKAGEMLRELVGRCKAQDDVIETMAGHMAIILHKQGGSVVITEVDRTLAEETVIQGYRTEVLEDDRLRLFTMTPEEYDDQRVREGKVDEARDGWKPKIIRP